MSSPEARAINADGWYIENIAGCPRSPEWKLGAKAGCRIACGMPHERSPWASGTAQDDAFSAGFQWAHAQVARELRKGNAVPFPNAPTPAGTREAA